MSKPLFTRVRLAAGWGMRSFAENCGLLPSDLSEIESGEREATEEEVHRIATMLVGCVNTRIIEDDPASLAPLQSIQESKPGDGPHTPPRGQVMIDENGHKYRPDRRVPAEAQPNEAVPVCPLCFSQIQVLLGKWLPELTIKWRGEPRCYVCRGTADPDVLKVMKAAGPPVDDSPEADTVGGVRLR